MAVPQPRSFPGADEAVGYAGVCQEDDITFCQRSPTPEEGLCLGRGGGDERGRVWGTCLWRGLAVPAFGWSGSIRRTTSLGIIGMCVWREICDWHALLSVHTLPTSHAWRHLWALLGLLGLASLPSRSAMLAVPPTPALDALDGLDGLDNSRTSGRGAPVVAGVRVCASGGHVNIVLNPRRHPHRRLTILLVRHVHPS